MVSRIMMMSALVVLAGMVLLCTPAMAGPMDKALTYILPPGDIQGQLLESDGVTPHANVKVTLKKLETGEEVASTVSDEQGKYTFAGVGVGTYLVYVGNPGLGAVLKVEEGAKSAALVIAVPEALSLSLPDSAPEFLAAGGTGAVLLGVGGAALCCGTAAAWHEYDRRRRTKLKKHHNSPKGPMPTWELQRYYDNLYQETGHYPK